MSRIACPDLSRVVVVSAMRGECIAGGEDGRGLRREGTRVTILENGKCGLTIPALAGNLVFGVKEVPMAEPALILPKRDDGRIWPAQGKWTYEDFLHLPDDGQRYEVIWGH